MTQLILCTAQDSVSLGEGEADHGWQICAAYLSLGLLTRSDTYWAVPPKKMARGLKFQIEEVEGLYYLCSENKGTDHLRSVTVQLICGFFSSPEPLGSQGELIVYQWIRRPSSVRRPQCSNIFFLETA